MGLSGPISASDVVAKLAPDDRVDGHRNQWGHALAEVAVAGLYQGHDRAAAAAKTTNLTGRCAITLTAGGRGGSVPVPRGIGGVIHHSIGSLPFNDLVLNLARMGVALLPYLGAAHDFFNSKN